MAVKTNIPEKYKGCDFCGWATRNDLRCSDGRTIRRDAFAHQDGAKVPLVWSHNHESPEAVLGHGYLENRPEGVFFYGYFNQSEDAQRAKLEVEHGDITSLSIWANQLKQKAGDVLHGSIKEVSLVLAGANMGAQITNPVIVHGDNAETLMDEAYIYVGKEYGLELVHADVDEDGGNNMDKDVNGGNEMDGEKTVQDVLDTMDEDQLKVVSYLVAQAAAGDDDDEEIEHDDLGEDATVQDVLDTMNDDQLAVMNYLIESAVEETADEVEHYDFGGDYMNFNAFEGGMPMQDDSFLSHSDEMDIIASAKKYGKLSDALAAYADENELAHDDDTPAVTLAPVSGATSYPNGATPAQVEGFFPEYHDIYPGAPQLVYNDQGWVKAVLNKVHKSPFSRVRTSYVDIREIEVLRARGYLKGREKVLAGNYTVAKRVTDPQTVYVKSALNHDDVVDITDFDYVDYQYKIDRMQLELEIARAVMIGDGRDDASADKINPEHIRPIWTDNDIFTIHKTLDLTGINGDYSGNFGDSYKYAQATEAAILDAKIDFKGTGTSDMFCTQAFFNKLMLAKDLNGRRLYANKGELTSALDVGAVYSVPEFANKTRTANNKTYRLLAIIGNLADYNIGQTKGGEIIHRTQFDIDFNQEKSLLETRISGATTRLYSFIVIEEEVVTTPSNPSNPG